MTKSTKWICAQPKKVREKSRECHNHKPQPFPDPKRKRKPTNLNKHKPNKRTKSTKISSLFPKRGNRNTKRTEKHKNKMTHGKTYNKSPRRINHKASNSKTNTGTTALERSVEQTDQSSLGAQRVAKDPTFLHADSEDSDQIGWISRLIFAGRTSLIVGFVVRWLNYVLSRPLCQLVSVHCGRGYNAINLNTL